MNCREEVQQMIDTQIQLLVSEMWEDRKVDEEKYLKYNEVLRIEK